MEEMHEMRVWSLGGEDSLEKENGNALQYYYQENPVDRGDWWATIHGATKSQKWLSSWAYTHTNNRLAPCPTPNSHTLPSSANDWLADTEVQKVGSLGSQQDQLCSVLTLQRTLWDQIAASGQQSSHHYLRYPLLHPLSWAYSPLAEEAPFLAVLLEKHQGALHPWLLRVHNSRCPRDARLQRRLERMCGK